MAPTPAASLKEIFRPWWVRWCAGPVAAIGVYDTIAGQAELPTLRKVLGMSSNLLPWWGWLLLLQAIFVAALFEYVRRNVGPVSSLEASPQPIRYDDTAIQQALNATSGQISELRSDIDRIFQEIAPLINERQARLRSELLTRLKGKKFPMPSAGDSWPSSVDSMAFNIDLRGWLSQSLAEAGITLSVADVIKQTAERINGNAVFCSIPAEENDGRWQDGESKQRWHRHNAALDAIISKVSSP